MKRVPGNPDYSPMAKELGISEETYFYLDEHNPEELDRLVAIFNQNAMMRKEETKKNRAINQSVKNLSHWYKTMSDLDRARLIKESACFMDDVISEAILLNKMPEMNKHYENLRVRITSGIVLLPPVTDKKIIRFPEYDTVKDSLYGKGYRFLALWAHCFSDKSMKKSIGKNKFYSM